MVMATAVLLSVEAGQAATLKSLFGWGRRSDESTVKTQPETAEDRGAAESPTLYRTPAEVCAYVRRKVRYRSEDRDDWASPSETLARGYGDCEDIAQLVKQLCRKNGMSADLYALRHEQRRREGHIIVIGRWRDRYWISSNGSWSAVRTFDEAIAAGADSCAWPVRRTEYARVPDGWLSSFDGLDTAERGHTPTKEGTL